MGQGQTRVRRTSVRGSVTQQTVVLAVVETIHRGAQYTMSPSATAVAAPASAPPAGSEAAPSAIAAPALATGAVEGIFIAEEAGGPMQSLPEAQVVQGRGIFGDRYCKRKGTYSVFRASKLNPGQREPELHRKLLRARSRLYRRLQ